jgi:hypothetical protein
VACGRPGLGGRNALIELGVPLCSDFSGVLGRSAWF